jgi:hypothetical protein
LLRACLGLDPVNELNMEHRMKWRKTVTYK